METVPPSAEDRSKIPNGNTRSAFSGDERVSTLVAGCLALALGAGAAGCPNNQGGTPPMVAVAQPVRVEPVRRLTFGPDHEVPPGTVFHIRIVAKAPGTTLMLNRCGVPCSTTTMVAFWFAHGYAAGDMLSRRVENGGTYYLWIRDDKRNEASAIVSDETAGSRLRMTFDSGAILEAWYEPPKVQ
jgi:hypothetical protein